MYKKQAAVEMILLFASCSSFPGISLTIKMEAVCSSKILVNFYWIIQLHIPENGSFHIHHCENTELYINWIAEKGEGTCKSESLETLTQKKHYSVASCCVGAIEFCKCLPLNRTCNLTLLSSSAANHGYLLFILICPSHESIFCICKICIKSPLSLTLSLHLKLKGMALQCIEGGLCTLWDLMI
jgi:hypothetical protein